jgi:hypothetical protein
MTFFSNIWHTLRDFYAARHEPENMRPLAEWYWRVLLTIGFFALVFVVVYGVWEFYGVMRKLTAGANRKHSEIPSLLNRKDLVDTLAAFEARVAEFEAVKKEKGSVVDPSR